jgi:hypothetical protein
MYPVQELLRRMASLEASQAPAFPYAATVATAQSQTDWYVDAVAGNDANPGTLALPLKTLAALESRLGGGVPGGWLGVPSGATITVHLLSADYSTQPTWQLRLGAREGGRVVIRGTQTILHSGRLSAATNRSNAANTPYQITDSAGIDWTPYVGLFVKLTSGANAGAMAMIAKALGGGAARTGEFIVPAFDNPTPTTGLVLAGNETYEVIQPSTLPQINFDVDGPCYFSNATGGQFASLYVTDCATLAPADGSRGYDNTISGNGVVWVQTSILGGLTYTVLGVFDTNNVYGGGGGGGGVVAQGVGFYQIMGGGSPATNTAHPIDLHSSQLFLDGNTLLNGGDVHVQTPCFLELGSLGMFDGSTWEVYFGSQVYFSDQGGSSLWGSSASASLLLHAGGCATYDSTYAFHIAGAGGGSFTMSGQTSIHTFRYDTGAFIGPINLTYANVVATYAGGGFGGSAMDPLRSGCQFSLFG